MPTGIGPDGTDAARLSALEALIEAAVRFGEVILRTPGLAEAEINPVLVRPEGRGLVAVDFLGTAKG